MATSHDARSVARLSSDGLSSRFVSIGTLSKMSGLSPQSLRAYERQGLLAQCVARSFGNHRRYHVQRALEKLFSLPSSENGDEERIVLAYARVSTAKQSIGYRAANFGDRGRSAQPVLD